MADSLSRTSKQMPSLPLFPLPCYPTAHLHDNFLGWKHKPFVLFWPGMGEYWYQVWLLGHYWPSVGTCSNCHCWLINNTWGQNGSSYWVAPFTTSWGCIYSKRFHFTDVCFLVILIADDSNFSYCVSHSDKSKYKHHKNSIPTHISQWFKCVWCFNVCGINV